MGSRRFLLEMSGQEDLEALGVAVKYGRRNLVQEVRGVAAITCGLVAVRYGTVRYSTVRYGTVRYGMVRYLKGREDGACGFMHAACCPAAPMTVW
jgi:hypothetical protein